MNSARSDLKSIFSQAADIASPADRGAYLDEACGEDTALRGEVEALLDAAEKVGSFMGGPAIAVGDTEMFPGIAERSGTIIGPYKLLQQIGEGGMGVVFMAEQSEPIQRTVALKIIKPGMDTRQVIARFEAERQALAMMDHPHIARVLDAGETATGRPYFVMELVKGTPITQYCDEHRLSIDERLELFVQVCQAVQHAHQKGIIHRDLKPSNVLVAEYDDQPVPKVIDFGVAKATAQKLTERTMFTEFGQVLGTLEYMSPEQAKLNQLDVDTRSDIYSLGVLLYELLTGSTPFERQGLREAAFDEILRIIREEEPPKPSTRLSTSDTLPSIAANRHSEPARLSREICGELDWIVMRSLEKDRQRRYQTASSFAEDLQHYLYDQPVAACPPSKVYRLKKFIRRNKTSVFAGSAIAVALLLGLIASSVGFLQARRQAEIARTHEKIAETEAARSEQVAKFLKDMLEGVGPSVAMGRDTAMLQDIVDKTAQRIKSDLKDQPEVQAELGLVLAEVYFQLQDYQKMEKMARQTMKLSRRSFGNESTQVADALSLQAGALMVLRGFDEAEVGARQAIALHRKLRGHHSVEEAETLRCLAMVLLGQADDSTDRKPADYYQESEQLVRLSAKIVKERYGDTHEEVAWSLQTLGRVLSFVGEYDEAEKSLREAVVIRHRLHGDLHPYLASDYTKLAGILISRGQLGEAEKYLRQALEIAHATGFAKTNLLSRTHDMLAHVLLQSGNPAEAEQHLREAVAIMRGQMGADYPDLPSYLCSLARLLRENGKLDDARAAAEEAFAICERNPSSIPNSYQFASIETLGSILAKQGDTAALKSHIDQWIGAAELSDDDDQVAGAVLRATHLLVDTDQREQAIGLGRKLLTLRPKTAARLNEAAWLFATTTNPANRDPALAIELAKKAVEQDPNAGEWWNTLGIAFYRAGNWQAAKEALKKSMALRNGGDANDWYFLAMIHGQLKEPDQARGWYDKAHNWRSDNQPRNGDLNRFGWEAAELLGYVKTQSMTETQSSEGKQASKETESTGQKKPLTEDDDPTLNPTTEK